VTRDTGSLTAQLYIQRAAQWGGSIYNRNSMNIEQSIAEHDKQIGQILTILSTVVDRQERLDNALVDLAAVQAELAEAQKKTEERIQNLVSAIGQFLSRP